jgi:LuxR family maltose regulon positive regulatory protein
VSQKLLQGRLMRLSKIESGSLPPARPNLVERQRLFDVLTNGLIAGRGLTLISAPAGYGKSVLAAEWIRNLQQNWKGLSVSWVSLEDSDNNPERFFSRLANLLLRKLPDAGFRIAASNENGPLPEPLEALLDEIIIQQLISEQDNENALNSTQNSRAIKILVLDDYHRINSTITHRAVQYLLDHSHPNLHILLITRVDPPLHLSRLRAHTDLTEIRMRDLVFNLPEATKLVSAMLETDLKPEWISALSEKTEGWAVGLQLAAVSLRQTSDIAGFIRDFKGSHRYLVDYLVDEVLKAQTEPIQVFLKRTSQLKYFNEELCSIITGQDLPTDILSQIEKANLFLIPLDENRDWYRYHHLFADCLQRQISPNEKYEVLTIASKWSEQMGYITDAVEYALATGDSNLSADTLERALRNPATWSSGYLTMLEDWFEKLPQTCVNCRPDLQIMASRALFLTGKIEESELLLVQGETILNSKPPDDLALIEALRTQISIYRSAIFAIKGELAQARSLIVPAMKNISPELTHIKARGWDTLGLIDELAGKLEDSYIDYLKASHNASKAKVLYLAINALSEAAMIRLMQGNLSEARNNCYIALSLAGKEQNSLPPAGLTWAILGEISREENNLSLAEAYIKQGTELALKGGIIDDLRQIFSYQVQLQASRRDYKMLREATGNAARILESYRIERLNNRAQAVKARTAVIAGDLHYAGSWAARQEKYLQDNPVEYIIDYEKLTLVRVKMAGNYSHESIKLCDTIIEESRTGGRIITLIEALILRTLAGWNFGLKNKAEDSFGEALALAAPEGHIRLFVDEGSSILPIIEQLLPNIKEPPVKAFCLKLKNACQSEHLPEEKLNPLSYQETKILELIADGFSNRAIADQLFISLGTAKWHAHNIYEKLGVSSRTQAIAKGQELNLIAQPENNK